MAILIAANQIYDIIENQKVIDNSINGIDTSEDEFSKTYGTVSNVIEITLYEWNDDGDFSSTDYNDFITYIGNEKNNETYNIQIHQDTSATYIMYITGDFRFNIDKQIKSDKVYLMIERDLQEYSNGTLSSHGGDVEKTNYSTQTGQIKEIDYYGQDEIFFNIDDSYWYSNVLYNYTMGDWVHGSFRNCIRLYIQSEYYDKKNNDVSFGEQNKLSIESNELLQTDSIIHNKKLSEYNYEQITQDWGEGKETATIKCSIGEYYQYDDTKPDKKGDLAISTQNNDLPMLFNINDLVIPYIATANGGAAPLSLTLDGKPKSFKVTQIRPYFDGAFWQELQLQEESDRYIETVVFTSGTDGNATAGYIAQNQTVVVTKGKIVSVSLNYSTEDINTAQVSPTVSINEADNSFTIANVNLVSPNSTANIYATVIHEI